jgi:integrase
MPRPRAAKIETATSRRKLPPRRKPYYVTVSPGVFLGYCRNQGHCKWSVRVVRGRVEWTDRFATTDDLEPANGRDVLSYWQAVDEARKLARGTDDAPDSRPMTVEAAVEAYERDLKTRGADPANAQRIRRHLNGALGTKPVMLLSVQDLRHWRDGLVAKGVQPATINRTRAGLRAALELAATLDHRITNRETFRLGLKGLRDTKTARRAVLPDADVLRIVRAAYEHDRAFGVLIEVLAQTGARISQAARLKCGDLQADGPDPRLLMPTSYKGGRGQKERQQMPVPIPVSLAALLKESRGDRPHDAPLLIKGDGTRWLEKNKSEQWNIFRAVAERAGFDPDEITTYALRHSSICRSLLKGSPISLVARLHDTSSDEIEAHYAAYILDVAGDALSRKGLLHIEQATADNVVSLPGRRS